jgi:hypothetical protein
VAHQEVAGAAGLFGGLGDRLAALVRPRRCCAEVRNVPIPERREAKAIAIPIGTTMTSATSWHFSLRRVGA